MKLFATITLFAGIMLPAANVASRQTADANEMLRRVDEYRNPLSFYSVDVDLTLLHRDETRSFGFRVFGNGAATSLLEFLTPATDKGKYYLMLKDDMWIYLPNTSRPIRISPLQRLAGEASNGDVARLNYCADYTAELGGEDNVDGHEALILELKGRDSDMSYSRVKLWVTRQATEPIKAEYYAMSGRLLKRIYFREFGMMNGKRIVSSIELQDAIRPDHRTVMKFANLTPKHYPEKMFNRNYMGKW